MHQTIFVIIISIIVFEYLVTRLLGHLNTRWRTKKLPAELQGIYKEDEYKKAQNYGEVNSRFSILAGTFQIVAILLMLSYGGFAWLDNLAHNLTEDRVFAALIFFGILFLASDILNTPFSIYSTFVIEEKFGFNKTTPKTFFYDKIKGWLIAIVLGGPIMWLIVWFYHLTAEWFWLYAWIAVSVVSIFMAMFYSNLIVPLFNKQTPLEEGELREAIRQFSEKAGFTLDNIFVIDGSKRSSKANAYFTGLGKKKRIVLFDTLINDLSKEEIVAVLAHEIGHYKLKHTISSMVLSIVQTGAMFYILSLFIGNPDLSKALGATQPTFELALITFGILFSPISTILGLFMNVFSRKNEYQADGFAAKFGQGEHLISALKNLTVKNLTNLTPHPAYVFVNYSHPTLYQRMMAIKEKKKD